MLDCSLEMSDTSCVHEKMHLKDYMFLRKGTLHPQPAGFMNIGSTTASDFTRERK